MLKSCFISVKDRDSVISADLTACDDDGVALICEECLLLLFARFVAMFLKLKMDAKENVFFTKPKLLLFRKKESMSATKSADKKSKKNDIQDVFGKLQPYLEKLIDLYNIASPYIDITISYAKKGLKQIEPYYNKYWKAEYIQVFIGFVLLFFGGTFAMSIACYMAIQLSGWKTIQESWKILKRNYNEGMEAFENDPNAKQFFDADGDGKISASEIGSAGKMLVSGTAEQKKAVLLNLRCVFVAIDPQEVKLYYNYMI